MKQGPVCISMLVALVLLGTGCSKQEPNPLIGVWKSPEAELRFHLDGSYVLRSGELDSSGFFEISPSGSIVVFTYEHRKAVRNMASRFDLDADRQFLSLDRTPAGTLVLSRNGSRQMPGPPVSVFRSRHDSGPRWPEVNASLSEPQSAIHRNSQQFEFPSP